ncbi:hypothetical protein ABPG75_006561 [Micractinium tetrahymenae]
MPPQVGRQARSRGGGGGRTTSPAPPSPVPDLTRLPRGTRETAMLLRANGYEVLNGEKLRRHAAADLPAQSEPARAQRQNDERPPTLRQAQKQQQQPQKRVQQQQREQPAAPPRRQVRLMDPAQQQQQQVPARRAGERKRKHASASELSSEEEERGTVAARPARSQQLAQPAQSQQTQGGGIKRVRSSWKMRPLLIDEKLAVFLEGQDDALLHYDGGEFHQWLKDCEAGRADPADGFPYPLVVQDKELRTLLEIKPPDQEPGGDLRLAAAAKAQAKAAAAAAAAGGTAAGIIVPTVRLLPLGEQPDQLVREHNPPVVQRLVGDGAELGPDVAGTSAAAQAASAAWRSAEMAVALDPPYIRYVQPTPDDLDLAVEYDLDEEDEEWLAQFNAEAKRAKSRKARRTLGEEWMEHLIDRMEKEYTAELQRHPGKWVVQAADPSASDQLPAVSLPSIDEVFPLEKCLQVPGINHYENVIRAVYKYWRAKHQRAGRPLIQRLWYEPPWDRRKAARLACAAGEEGGEGEEGPFHAQDSPVALAGIRKRRMDPEEVKSRFQEIRRDLESARTLADQVRKREKLKKRELQLYKEEWAARMQAIRDGAERVVVRSGRVKDPPAQLSAVWRLEAAGAAGAWDAPAASAETSEGEALLAGAPQDAAAQAEERAARLAMRRFARDVGATALQQPQRQQAAAGRRPAGRPRSSAAATGQRRERGQRAGGSSGAVLKQAGNVRGPPPAPGVRRVPTCVWCGSSEFLLLGCASCPRCFCFKCFQRRPGLGINNWSRAVKDSRYRCVICRGLEAEDAPSASTADALPAADAADATSPLRSRRPAPPQQPVTAARLESERRAEELGVEVPRGLGGAALRSFLNRRQKELEEAAEEEEEEEEGGRQQPSEAAAEEEEEEDPEAEAEAEEQPAARAGQRPHRATAGATHQRRQQLAGGSSDEGDLDEDYQRRPKQRRLGGAALASHLRRLEQRRQERAEVRQQGAADIEDGASDAEQPSSSRGGGGGSEEDEEPEWPYPHIPPPSRKLGGAALRSYVKRQEALLEEEGSEAAASSEHGDGWPHAHIPPPSRKLGGAALRSYIKRQEALLKEAAEEERQQQQHHHHHHHGHHQPQRSGSSSGTAEEFGTSSEEEAGGAASAGSSSGGESELKENRAPPSKRPRKGLGGAALASHLRKLAAAEAAAAAGRRTATGHARRGGRDARH